MEFSFLMLTEGANADQTGKLHAGAPILFLALPAFPATFSFTILFGLLDIDITVPHECRLELLDPNNNRVFDQSMGFPAQPAQPIQNELGLNAMVSSVDLRNFLFKRIGTYTYRVTMGGVSESRRLKVTKQILEDVQEG